MLKETILIISHNVSQFFSELLADFYLFQSVLISRKKNSSQGRMDFSDKKTKYFKNNIELFRNSLKIYTNYTKWTPAEIEKNHQEVLEKIEKHYC
jgi:hypothetical protein